MAMALGMDYWMVPQVTSNYHTFYTMTKEKADAVVKVLKHVILKQGLGGLLASREEL